MPETTAQFHRIPVADCEVTATIELSKEKAIKALYCGKEKKIRTYLFDVKRWSMEQAQAWVAKQKGKQSEAEEITPFFALSLPAAERLVSGDLSRIVHMGDLEEVALNPVLVTNEGRMYAKVVLSRPESIGADIYSYDVEVLEVYDPPREIEEDEQEQEQSIEAGDVLTSDDKNGVELTLLDERVSWRLPPFSSEGGSYFLAPTVRGLFSEHNVYCEPYCGASNILFSKYPVDTEVLNDTDTELIQAYEDIRALSLDQLIELRGKNWHPWKNKFESLKGYMASDAANRLYRFLYLSWYSFNENRKDYRGRPKNWSLEARLGRVENARVRLREVKLTSEDGIACITRWDSPTTAFFLDPPFPAEGDDITSLHEALRGISGRFVLRISDTPEHRDLLSEYNVMSTTAVKRAGQASAWENGEIVRARSELLVTNCVIPEEAHESPAVEMP